MLWVAQSDPKVASGPIMLALSDLATLTCWLRPAAVMLA